MTGVYHCMNLGRGCVFDKNHRENAPVMQAKAHLPGLVFFGIVAAPRKETTCQILQQCVFNH